MPYRSPGAPKGAKSFLKGKPIRYYRPKGSAAVRTLIDDGFQAFNAARLGEACRIYCDKMLSRQHDTTIALTIAGAMTPAGLGGCVISLMERGLIDFIISTGANLYHDLHYALNFTLRRGSPFVDDRVLYSEGVIRIYDVLFPAQVLLDTDGERDGGRGLVRRTAPGARPAPAQGASRLRRLFGGGVGREVRRADLHLVARRQLDRNEHRLPRADQRQHAADRSQQGRKRGLRHHPRR
jgi:hypothetical protein